MMLLRTLVLERSGEDAPVNGALLCGFSIAQIDSNFLVYSLDEEVEPGSSRVYIAALRKKLDRYFLGGVESKENLQVAMQVFKQILMAAAAAGTKGSAVVETAIPFHFIDLKGCKLPPARPDDHHSIIIKKALVMKVITLGMSAPVLPAIESATLIVPSIRFSSQSVSPPKTPRPPSIVQETAPEPVKAPVQMPEVPDQVEPAAPPAQHEPQVPTPPRVPAHAEHVALLEVDSTLTNLAKVAQELAQKKLAIAEREQQLEQWQARLQKTQGELDEKGSELEHRENQLQQQTLEVGQRSEKLALATSNFSAVRQRLQGVLHEMDRAWEG